MASAELIRLRFLLLLSAAILTGATDHIVGGHLGWNPNINYSLWSNNQTFYVHDLISFRYPKNMYNVFEVNKTGYDNCTMDGLVGNWSSGKDFIHLDQPKTYYFICGNGLCFSGMKVAVRVFALPTSAASHTASNSSSRATSASPVPRPWPATLVALAAVLAVAWIGIGSAGI
ncbi:mavicyanin [Elaeis guineensis]|uniref:Lamin-like protein n=1 Tax=Elaeis guineensis var. tenera TaxID=51953 RepID=A0A6I9QRF7_ELAGV|nr:lamin-like protein [Elaeis guineensis]